MKTYWGTRNKAPHIFNPALDGGEWLASLLGRFTPESTLDTHWIRGWMGSRADLDAVVRKRIEVPAGKRTLIFQHLQ